MLSPILQYSLFSQISLGLYFCFTVSVEISNCSTVS
nr:MAG TPA: hypothetical protein [Caudoviricetes sp.]